MNHLAGLDVECPTTSLSQDDAAVLAAFRGAHEAAKPVREDDRSYGVDYDGGSDASCDLRQTSVSHRVDSSSLPPCGWRPLDDSTLYRFLCADRRGDKFQPDKSSSRLRKALSFRKEEGVDDILMTPTPTTGSTARERGPSPRSVTAGDGTPSYGRSDSVASLTSIASGTISDCGERVHDVTCTTTTCSSAAAPSGSASVRPPRSHPRSNPKDGSDKSAKAGSGADDDLMNATEHTEATAATSSTAATATGVTKLCPRDLQRYQKLRVRVFVGRDRKDQPVLFERLGHFLGSGVCDHFSEDEWIRLYIWDLERHFVEMRKASVDCGRAITRFTYVADAEGITSGIMNRAVWRVMPLLKALTRAVEEHYPEIADKIVLFNVPRIASVFYRAVRAFLDPVTAEKIELHSGIPTGEFERIMSPSVIPVEYGGTNDVEYPPAVTTA